MAYLEAAQNLLFAELNDPRFPSGPSRSLLVTDAPQRGISPRVSEELFMNCRHGSLCF